MVSLTFGEQVKIVLSRKGMTVKELAEEIETKTGKKMSRQNLTQRLGRDNFQEQDMRMIADILGCPFQLTILENAETENAVEIKEGTAQVIVSEEVERDLTVGELVEMMGAEPGICNSEEETEIDDTDAQTEVKEREDKADENTAEQKTPGGALGSAPLQKERRREYHSDFQPIKKRVDEDEDRENGDINPYTGHEYRTNSVRMHPKRIGYVQVYDRRTHKWTDMTEWAFLGFEERKKAIQGKDYEPPTYLD